MDVSVRELKNRLSEYLRSVEAGETLVVTSRGKVIAEISAPRLAELSPEERLARMAADGEIRLPRRSVFAPVRRTKVRGRPVSRSLLEDRG